jgi:hypothetical protein
MIVKINKRKNRLYMKISGNVSKRALDSLYTDVRFAVADLQPGFGVVNDLTECTLCHITGVATYKKITNYLVQNGVRDVVRIINKDSVVLRQFLNFASRFAEYIPLYVSTPEEAEEQLDRADKRSRLRFHFANLPPVEYVTNGTKGEGRIFDISTSGSKISSATILPAADEEIELVIAFNAGETDKKTFSLKASVVSGDTDEFTVEHKDVSEEEEERLWQYLMSQYEHETQQCPVGVMKT